MVDMDGYQVTTTVSQPPNGFSDRSFGAGHGTTTTSSTILLRKQKITLGEMRQMGVRGLLVYCSDYRSHWTTINADRWPDDVRLSDLEPLFVCQACGTRPAELRPDFEWSKAHRGNVQRPH